MANWTLFSNHGHVLVCLARDSEARLRDVATDVGITERAVQKIVRDLQDGGMISITKSGRRNCYRIHRKQTLRHDLEAHCSVGKLMQLIQKKAEAVHEVENMEVPPEFEPTVKTQKIRSRDEPEAAALSKSPPVEEKAVKPRPLVPPPVKKKPARRKTTDSKEKQQGSLF
jgi:DNA-binding IscR family transcriptional regulator